MLHTLDITFCFHAFLTYSLSAFVVVKRDNTKVSFFCTISNLPCWEFCWYLWASKILHVTKYIRLGSSINLSGCFFSCDFEMQSLGIALCHFPSFLELWLLLHVPGYKNQFAIYSRFGKSSRERKYFREKQETWSYEPIMVAWDDELMNFYLFRRHVMNEFYLWTFTGGFFFFIHRVKAPHKWKTTFIAHSMDAENIWGRTIFASAYLWIQLRLVSSSICLTTESIASCVTHADEHFSDPFAVLRRKSSSHDSRNDSSGFKDSIKLSFLWFAL